MLWFSVPGCVHAPPAPALGPVELTVSGAAPDVLEAVLRLSGRQRVLDPGWAATRVVLEGEGDSPPIVYLQALEAALSHLAAPGSPEGALGPPRLPTPTLAVRVRRVTVRHADRVIGEPLSLDGFVAAAGPDWFATACACDHAASAPLLRPGGRMDDLSGEAAFVLDGDAIVAVRKGDALSDGRTVTAISLGAVRLSDDSVLLSFPRFDEARVTRDAEGRYVVPDDALAPFRPGVSLARMLLHRGDDGEYDGYRLSAIRSGSPLDGLGIENGDVVHRLWVPAPDGRSLPLTSMEEAKAAWELLWTESAFCVDLRRHFEPLTLCYQITGRPPSP